MLMHEKACVIPILSLCKSGCIPEEHHPYFEALVCDKKVTDTVDDDLDEDTDID